MENNIIKTIDMVQEKFLEYRTGIERKYLYLIFLVYLPFIGFAFYIRANPYSLISGTLFKLIVFILIIATTIIHFVLKNTFFKNNRLYKNFIINQFKAVQIEEIDQETISNYFSVYEKLTRPQMIFKNLLDSCFCVK